jgi:hypothetical protein
LRIPAIVGLIPASTLKRWGCLNDIFPGTGNELDSDYFHMIVQAQKNMLGNLIDAKEFLGR